jgi:hypothetical protein
VVAFFAICALYVKGCERIIGPEEATGSPDQQDAGAEEAAAVLGGGS